MSNTTTTSRKEPQMTTTYDLVAIDLDDNGLKLETLLSRIGDALVSYKLEKSYSGAPAHRLTISSAKLRNTEAHGIGYRLGFLVHCEVVGR
jgi:hypothetical protein